MSERYIPTGFDKENEDRGNSITRLSAVVEPMDRRGLLYIGWNSQGLPQISNDVNRLGKDAIQSFQQNQKARLPIRRVESSRIAPVNYMATGQPIDYEGATAKDLLTYSVQNQKGERETLTIDELSILEAISNSDTVWQDLGKIDTSDIAVSTQSMYTLIVKPDGDDNRTDDLAILFKPALDGQSNESAFKSFMRQTLGKLLVLDESQPPENRKGYIEAASKFTPGKGANKLLSVANFFYDFGSDAQLINTRKMKAGFYKFARALGMYEISDEDLNQMKESLPYYDVDTMDINTLFKTSEAMHEAASRILVN